MGSLSAALIDEARPPLIISETLPDELGVAVYQKAIELARQLEVGRHYLRRDRELPPNKARWRPLP